MTDTDKIVLPSQSADGYAHIKANDRNFLIRAYLWIYGADRNNINTCKLLWAVLFAIPAFLVRLVIEGVKAIDRVLPDQRMAEQEAKRNKGPGKMERFLDAVAAAFASAYAKAAPVLKYVWFAFIGLAGLAAAIFLVTLAINHTGDFFAGLGILVGCLAVGLLIVLGIIRLEERSEKQGGLPFFKTMGKLFKGFHHHTCAKINLD